MQLRESARRSGGRGSQGQRVQEPGFCRSAILYFPELFLTFSELLALSYVVLSEETGEAGKITYQIGT